MRRSVVVRLALALALSMAAVLSTAAPRLAHAQKPSAKDLETAKNHFLSGASYYKEGLYTDAIREFQRSYDLSKKADILYNIAQCHGKLGDDPTTVVFLERYLAEKPNADDKTAVEVWIKNLKAKIAAASRPPEPSPTPSPSASPEPSPSPSPLASPEPTPSPSPSASPDDDLLLPKTTTRVVQRDRGKTTRLIGYITAGVGVAMIGGGIFFGIKARQSADHLEAYLLPPDQGGVRGIYDQGAKDIEDEGQQREKNSIILYSVGAVVTVGGGVLWYLGHRRRAESVTITERQMSVTGMYVPGGGGAVVQGQF